MKSGDIFLTFVIILIFCILYAIPILGVGIQKIKNNWPLYRCNPVVMPFAGVFGFDTGSNFAFCIQNMQTSFMDELLKPIHYSTDVIGKTTGELNDAIQSIRAFFNKIRNFITSIVQEIMGVFLNLLIGIQQVIIGLKDIFAKTIGILASLLFVLSGTMMTMKSAWDGAPGQIARTLCFHPTTLIKLQSGEIKQMKDVSLGDVLKNGQIVQGTMQLYNKHNNNYIEDLYSLPNGEFMDNIQSSIFVSGSHLIFDTQKETFVFVKDYSSAYKTNFNSDTLVCLITSNHTIPLGNYIFHDWEDNH